MPPPSRTAQPLFASKGQIPEARWNFEQSIRLKPDYIDAYSNLANALLQTGASSEATRRVPITGASSQKLRGRGGPLPGHEVATPGPP